MTFVKKFESIKKKIAAQDASLINEKIAMQVNMVDEDCGGAFYIEVENGALSVEPYDYNDRTVMLTLRAADFVALVDKKASLEDLVESGNVSVDGNWEHAQLIFSLKKIAAKKTTKKAPAKKAAEKKTTVKTEKAEKAEKKPETKKTETKTAAKTASKSAPKKTEDSAKKAPEAKKTTKK